MLFALLTILLMCGFQKKLVSMPRCVASGTALSGLSCIHELSMSGVDVVMCITSHLEGLNVICQDCSQSISLSKSCCKLYLVSVLIDFSVEHCIISE